MYRCLVVTLGRDAPGVNAAIRAVTRIAGKRKNWKVYGARRGFPGILNKNIRELGGSDVRFILDKGGSMLGSTVVPIGLDDVATLKRIGGFLQEFDLVVAIGGLGSFSVLNQVYNEMNMGVTTTLFVPASIENEFYLAGSASDGIHAESIGADTAANTGVSIIDRLRDQSYLNRTVFLVQTVGAKSNFLPLTIGLSCGAHRMYLPEFPRLSKEQVEEIQSMCGDNFIPSRVDVKEIVEWVKGLFAAKRSYALVVIPSNVQTIEIGAAGDGNGDYEQMVRSLVMSDFSLLRLVDDLQVHFSDNIGVQIRSVILDDLQRGGAPSMKDRLLGTLYGEAALEEYLEILNAQDSDRHANLSLLAVQDVYRGTWDSYPRESVVPLFKAKDAVPGGLDPVPFYRQSAGLLSGFRKLAALDDL